jgi:hypothetical protein
MATSSVSPKTGKITDVPAEPTIGTATGGGEKATVTFTANTSGRGGAVSSYVATSNPGGITGTGTTSPLTVPGLTANTAYTFTVSGVGVSGQGYPSDASNSVTPTVANYYAQFISSPGKNFPSLTPRRSMPVDSSGNVYVAGLVSTTTSATPVVSVAKITSTGIGWNTAITASQNNGGIGNTFVDGSGNFYYTTENGSPAGIKVYKLSSTGSITWQKLLTGTSPGKSAVTVDSSGNVIIATSSFNGSNYDGCLIKLDSSGSLTWQVKLASSNSYDYFEDVSVDSSGNIYTTGWMFINAVSNVIAKYNSGGTLQWQRSLIGPGSGTPPLYGIAVESSGSNVYITGRVSETSGAKWVVAKYNSSGTIQWQRSLIGDSGSTGNTGSGVSVDSSDNAYAYGNSTISTVNTQCIVKYNSSGTLQWQRSLSVTGYTPEILSVIVVSNKMYVELYVNNKIINLVLPDDGTLTGTYSVSGYTVVYATTSLTAATPSYTSGTQTWTASTNTTFSLSNNTETSAAGDLTVAKVGL